MWWNKISIRRKAEILGLLLVTISLFVLLSLIGHSFTDDRWFAADPDEIWVADYQVRNAAGLAGGWVAFLQLNAFGFCALGWPLFGLLIGIRQLFERRLSKLTRRFLVVILGIFSLGILTNLRPAATGIPYDHYSLSLSGTAGYAFSGMLSHLFGVWGAGLFLVAILGAGAYWMLPWHGLAARLSLPMIERSKNKGRLKKVRVLHEKRPSRLPEHWQTLKEKMIRLWQSLMPVLEEEAGSSATSGEPDYIRSAEPPPQEFTQKLPAEAPTESPAEDQPDRKSPRAKLVRAKRLEVGDFVYPELDLLPDPPHAPILHRKKVTDAAESGSEALRRALQTFDIGIAGETIDVCPGPVITRYEFQPAAGIKINQILGLADDLALALRARRVRIVAPVPGKAAVGIEVPNLEAETVYIREILQSKKFAETKYHLPLALGKDISGSPFVADLAGMPHLLIAGATGSGKSVCINVIITSLLYRLHPRELRFLFVDPKMLELSIYQGIPHLEKNVVSRPRGAERLFEDCVREMEERYRLLAGRGVRGIAEYNTRVGEDEKLPYVVVIVDELADLMMSPSANKIENLITRLAQMARAVGIHLVLATQRPSVDVITGLIKANFSSRIAFQVASKVDSRTILDCNGAEKLLGNGDLLFLSPGTHEPVRLHGAFIGGEQTEKLVEFFKAQVVEAPKIKSFDEEEAKRREQGLDAEDMVLRQAAEVVVRHKQGSVSLLQRRLGVGYQRAARLIDKLEEAGVVGPYDGSKAREVLITQDGLQEKFGKPATEGAG